MRPCTRYSLRIEDQGHPQARLLRDGVATGWRVDGRGVLVDALEAGSRSGLGGAGILDLRRHGDDWLEVGLLKGSPAC